MVPSQKFRSQLAKAKKGNTEAQAFVYSCYYFGDEGVTRDLTLAVKFCRMAAEGGHTECQHDLGGFFRKSDGVERDDRKASAWFLRAAKGGDVDAQLYTANRYKDGDGHDAPNVKETFKWYQAAAAQGDAAAQLELGICYDDGDGVKMNPGLALWRKCAQHVHEAGYAAEEEGFDSVAAAHNNIGNCYSLGTNGVEVDMPAAMQWWTKAAAQGNVIAQCTIGEIYLMGFDEDVPVGTFDRDVPL
jgi:TPR repeat protein